MAWILTPSDEEYSEDELELVSIEHMPIKHLEMFIILNMQFDFLLWVFARAFTVFFQ